MEPGENDAMFAPPAGDALGPYRNAAPLPQPSREEIARKIVTPHLREGEATVWIGWPLPGWRFSPADVVAVPFSLVWGGIAAVVEWIALVHGGPFFVLFLGLLLVAVSQYLVWGRFVVDARRRAHTFYALTDSRALIVVAGRWERVRSIDLRASRDIEIVDGRRRGGTITFGTTPWVSVGIPPTWPSVPGTRRPAFEHIDDAREAYAKILEIQRGPSRSR